MFETYTQLYQENKGSLPPPVLIIEREQEYRAVDGKILKIIREITHPTLVISCSIIFNNQPTPRSDL